MVTQKPQGYNLTEPPVEPSAKPGCSACLSIVVARQNVRSWSDSSGVTDRNVELLEHHAEAH